MTTRDLEGLCADGIRGLMQEMADVDLGDERRSARLLEVMAQLASAPSGSLASMCESEAQAEALYRLLRNEHVDWLDVVQPHLDKTVDRGREAKRVLAVHDSSAFRVADAAKLDSYISTGKKGFVAHATLLFDLQGAPLGVAALEVLRRAKKQKRTKTRSGRSMTGAETAKLKGRESGRWWRGVEQVEDNLQGVHVTHVMDREGDSFELLSQLMNRGCQFVIRRCKARNTRLATDEPYGDWSPFDEVLKQARELEVYREVPVSPRRAKTAPAARRASPPREQRMASLRMASCQVQLKKPRYLNEVPDVLTLNVVRVYEPAAPHGETPIEWTLLTNLPLDADADAEHAVDIYRCRWPIEEFFKAHKTGCNYRTRCLTNEQTILNSFAAFIPIAWKALALRHLAQVHNQPAELVLEPAEMAVLRAKAPTMRMSLPPSPTVRDVLSLVARLGGYRKSSRPPGWLILTRGLEKLQALAEGWALAGGKM